VHREAVHERGALLGQSSVIARLGPMERALERAQVSDPEHAAEPNEKRLVERERLLQRGVERDGHGYWARRWSSSACSSMTSSIACRNAGLTRTRRRCSTSASSTSFEMLCPVSLAVART